MKMKKITALALCIAMLLMHSIVSFAAEDEQLPSTGLIWDTWESYMENMNETTLRALTTQRMGDVDADGRISASDARLCLRAAASLEALTEPQSVAADVNNSTDITSSDARKVLRVAAGLDVLENMSVETTADWGVVIGALTTSGSGQYYWQCSVDKIGLTVNEYTVESDSKKDGAPVEQYFAFTPEAVGTYTINFKLANGTQNDVIDEFQVNVLVNAESVSISQGEQFCIDGLKNAGSGRYNWKYIATPDTGLEVTESTIIKDDSAVGAPVEQVFTFTGTQKGEYQIHFELIATGESTPINEFYLNITVN